MKRFGLAPLAVVLAVVGLALGTLVAMAQQPGGQGGPGGPGGRGGFDPAQFRERMAEMMKERLGATDEEWKALQPLVEAVQEKQQAVRALSMGGFGRGGFGRGGDRGGDQGGNRGGDRGGMRGVQASPEIEALRKALDSKDTPAAEIQARIKAVRAARVKAEADLKTAREALRKVLTARQEGELFLTGLLD